ncbi:MAG: thymidine phosphorylase family protein [Candidatus Binataceae bacterium]
MFKVKHLPIDTLREHVITIHESAVRTGNLGFNPLDRARVFGSHPVTGAMREVVGVLNFCSAVLVAPDEIGLCEEAFRDLGLPEGATVNATLAAAPHSVDFVRGKLAGKRLNRAAFDAILTDVVDHRYSRVELSMFVLACSLKTLDLGEIVDYTRAMIATGTTLDFGPGVVADKHSIGGVPGNRTTMIVVPILSALGIKMPKTSSRAITSPAGTADTMSVVAEVALSPQRLREIVEQVGGCIAWGGAVKLAPADDILITVERPMEIDTEAQMVASILAKKKSVGATDVLIDIPVGPTAKIRNRAAAGALSDLFRAVATEIDLRLEVAVTNAPGPIGRGIGPRLEALDVLKVLRRDADAAVDLREKSLYLAARILEMAGRVPPGSGYRTAQHMLDSGGALAQFERIVQMQGTRELPPIAPYRQIIPATEDGRIREIDCWEIARVAKRAGAPANLSAGVLLFKGVGDIVAKGEPLLELHAESATQLEFARSYADSHPEIVRFGF